MAQAKLYRIKHAATPWQVSAYLPGNRRVRKHFSQRPDAVAYAAQLNAQFRREGTEGVNFGAEARADYSSAVKRLAGVGATLGDAVQFYLDRHVTGPEMPVADALGALLRAKATANRRPCTINGLRIRVRAFLDHAGAVNVSDVNREAVEKWLARPGIQPRTRQAARVALSAFCHFCRARGWMKDDPLEGIERVTIDPVTVRILTPEQAARLMAATAKYDQGRFVRAVALRLFAGIRPAEVDRLAESDIHANVVRIGTGKIRGRRAVRTVPVSPVLRAWLDLYPNAPLAFTDTVWRWHLKRIRLAAGLGKAWCADICRKTWISYRMAELQNEAQVAREAGNSPDVIYRHYFDLVDVADVAKFGAYSVYPPPKTTVR